MAKPKGYVPREEREKDVYILLELTGKTDKKFRELSARLTTLTQLMVWDPKVKTKIVRFYPDRKPAE